MKRFVLLVTALVLGSVLEASPGHAAANLGLQVNSLQATAKAGAAVYLTGTAPAGRTAALQVLRGGKWITISAQSGSGADFSFRVPTGYYGIRTVRAYSPQSGVLGEIDGDAKTMNVVPTYTPSGTKSQTITLNNGYRWNPCAPIKYKVNFAGFSSSNLKLIRAALARVSKATGFTFSYAGTSRVVPFGSSWNRSVPAAGLYFGFVTAKNVPAINGIAGLGGEGSLVTTSSGAKVVRSGGVALEKRWWRLLAPGFRNGTARGGLLLHEIGHAMGLMHVNSKSEVMYPVLGSWSHSNYGWGDLVGLQQLGADQGCLS